MNPTILQAILKSVTVQAKSVVPIYITTADAAILLPGLEAEMKSLPAAVISINELVEKAKKAGRLTSEDPGLFTRCMQTEGAKKSTNPGAYCASIHKKILGRWPAEDPEKSKKKSKK